MKKMTEENVKASLAGESQAHIRYLAYAEKAGADGLPNMARAFTANAYAEQVHATNYLKALGGLGDTAANLKEAIAGETFEVDEMYPAYISVAMAQDEKKAEMLMNGALEAEKAHRDMYQRALDAAGAGKDLDNKAIHVCPVCGFTMEGEAPDKCPVCGTPKSKFHTF